MKKLFALVLCLAMVFAFVGCGKEKAESKSLTVKDGVLTMATNASFPPYEFYDGEKIVGIDAEVAGLIAEKLGLTLEIADTEFDSIIPGVQTGKYDMGMAGMTVTDERLKKVCFSSSYAKGIQAVIVKEDSAIKAVDDVKGDGSMKIGVQQGTTGDIYASNTVEKGGYGEKNVVRYANGGLAVEGLKGGKVDCVIIDNEPAKSYVAANKGLKILDTSYADEDYAICFAKENTELQEKVNKALEELIADGSVKKVVEKYIPAE